ncbi:polymorphic toxin type 50 domain-containing protein [Fusobacterium animalis]|uniref:polymorphic toxin type 50 domain-containing protein n=1 Tax=Fusobacterium animalis TaxID=76859 RepID=UPI0021C43918|nr:polymorphic toxin type 50 domain-containing protein [Fusobacterium animalis]
MAAPLFLNPVTVAITSIAIIGYTFAPQETKDKINQAVINGYEKIKNRLPKLLGMEDEKEITITIIRNELLEQGIIADVTIDENTGKININEILSSKNSNGKKEGQVPQKRDDKKENINKNDKGSEDNKEPNNDEKKQTPKKSEDNFNKKTNPNASTNKTQSGKATLNEGKQGKHVVGHNNFQQGKSEVDMETARNVLNDFQDTGQKFFDENGQKLKEVVDTNGKYTGIFVDKDTGQRSITSRFTIHYDSKGTAHIVPANPNPK